MKKRVLPFCSILAICFLALASLGQAFVSPYKMRVRPFLTGLDNPILIRNAKDGTKRLFVVQQSGIIKVVQPGSITPANFLDLHNKINFSGEQGLLGMAFHPNFALNGKFYVYYNRSGDGTIVIAEYRVTGDANQGDISTERILLTIPHPGQTNHNGGMIEFGPDGYLYMGTGDGGSGNDPPNNAQNRARLLGKMLRIDVDIPNGSPNPYLIPPSNPFVGANTARCDNGSTTAGNTCQEIWAIGMRNPWRWSFDRGGTHQLYVADVGQGALEELDIVNGGGNYGWRVYEGNQCTGLDPNLCTGGTNPITQTPPFFQYTHVSGRCAVTGGYVYRGTQGSLPFGSYVFADYCSGEIWIWQNNTQTLLQDTSHLIVSFGEDEDGEIYVCYQDGEIDKISRATSSADFDGDTKADFSIYRPDFGNWFSINSSNGNSFQMTQFGIAEDIPTPADFDGDNITDIAVFRPSAGFWFVIRSSDSTVTVDIWGTAGDVPVAADYDGDKKADRAVWRPSSGSWFISRSSDAGVTFAAFGLPTDKVAPGDYDGDGKADIGVYRPAGGSWFTLNSSNGQVRFTSFGIAEDISAPGDYDGDGRTDIALYRPSAGLWFIIRSSNGTVAVASWGISEDKPQPADYDGDGKDDVAVYRPSGGMWFVIRSSDAQVMVQQWGINTDVPIPGLDNR